MRCSGGEASHLRNRYPGRTGACSNLTKRDVLRAFHVATSKGGPWSGGADDWANKSKPICKMTGIACGACGRVTSISLRNRSLKGHIPNKVGSLAFLESLDMFDNRLMGYLPSDLQWTSVTRLDVSGNRMRGLISPLLCMMEELNGNGGEGAFCCDRIACPAGMYNSIGRHMVNWGEACRPCNGGVTTPFIGQKACAGLHGSGFNWKKEVEAPLLTGKRMGLSPVVGLGIAIGALLLAVILCCLARVNRKNRHTKCKLQAANEAKAIMVSPRACNDE
jgi:hypothetical protein